MEEVAKIAEILKVKIKCRAHPTASYYAAKIEDAPSRGWREDEQRKEGTVSLKAPLGLPKVKRLSRPS
eukprot:jgi/Bigna1/137935/aug1.42_g12643